MKFYHVVYRFETPGNSGSVGISFGSYCDDDAKELAFAWFRGFGRQSGDAAELWCGMDRLVKRWDW